MPLDVEGGDEAVALRATPRPSRLPWWAEAMILFALYQGFEQLRGLVVGRGTPAQRHAHWVVDLERWTWTLHEARLNQLVVAHKTLAQAMNIYYGTIHFVVPPLVLVWLWRRHPAQYRRWLAILAALTIVGLVFFATFPLAPPRLYSRDGVHFVDTSTRYGGLGPLDRGNFKDNNPYAAMPSLHIAWSTWCACAVISASALGRRRRWLRWLALLYPALTLLVVMATANHWFLDGVGGWLALALAWWGVDAWRRRTPFRRAPVRGTQERGAVPVGAPGI